LGSNVGGEILIMAYSKRVIGLFLIILFLLFSYCPFVYAKAVNLLPHRAYHVANVYSCPVYFEWQYQYHSTLKHLRWYTAAVGGVLTIVF